MDKNKSGKPDPLAKRFSKLGPTEDEFSKVKAAERSGDAQQFVRQLTELDRKYKVRSLETLGVDKKLINPQASRPRRSPRSIKSPARRGSRSSDNS